MHAILLAGVVLLSGATSQQTPSVAERDAPAPVARATIEEQLGGGRYLLNQGRYEDAIEAFNQILARIPDYGPALANRALAYAWTNRLDEATRDLDAASADMDGSALLHQVRASIAQRRSDTETAISEYTRSLELEPGNPLALRSRAWLYYRAGNEDAALADAETLIGAYPHQPDAYVLKADLLIGARQRAPAAAEANRLMTMFADDSRALAAAARIFDALADRPRAMAAIDRAVALDPEVYDYRMLRGRIRRWDDFAGRRADFEAALEVDPGNNEAITYLALVDFKEQKWRDSIARFSAILALEPRDFGVLAYRAMARLRAGDRELAERDHQAAMATASGADDFNLICSSFASEGIALAWGLEACNRALSLDPDESAYHSNRALIELRMGQLDAALADYGKAIAQDPRRAAGYFGRSVVLRRQGNDRAAAADRTEALAIDPAIVEMFEEFGLTDL